MSVFDSVPGVVEAKTAVLVIVAVLVLVLGAAGGWYVNRFFTREEIAELKLAKANADTALVAASGEIALHKAATASMERASSLAEARAAESVDALKNVLRRLGNKQAGIAGVTAKDCSDMVGQLWTQGD